MAPEDEPQHSVNDISHLFLSNVRSLAGNGVPRPQRKPPGTHSMTGGDMAAPATAGTEPVQPAAAAISQQTRATSIDLTPEELAQVFGSNGRRHGLADEASAATTGESPAPFAAPTAGASAGVAPVAALLASHLGVRQLERARDYARHLAASGQRVGLIDLDVSEFRLYCFDPSVEPGVDIDARPAAATGIADPREIAEALEELNVDIDRWLLLLPNLRTPEARAMIRNCQSWTLLTTCDHDGIVAAYRTLKGVVEGHPVAGMRISLTTLDAAGDAEAARVQQKLAGVGEKFLGCKLQAETPVRYAAGVAEHPLMNCRVTRDKAQLASAPHWAVVTAMLARRSRTAPVAADAVAPVVAPVAAEPPPAVAEVPPEPAIRRIEPAEAPAMSKPASTAAPVDNVSAAPKIAPAVAPAVEFSVPRLAIAASVATANDEVIDLPGDAEDVAGIVAAVLRRPEFGVVECPLPVPACPSGRLAVGRDRGLILVAVASEGLSELRSIGKAFQWMLENRSLIAMAMPQFAIDTSRTPAILLLVDQADISGEVLRPMVKAEHVSVRAYRRLRWAGRMGLLLEAA